MNDDGHFRLTDPQGNIIARGPLDMLMERIPQSVPRMRAEEAIAAAAKAVAREQRLEARADSLDERERAIEAREQKADAAALRSFCDSVTAVGRRLDALVEAREQERLADEIAAADIALKALRDEGDLEPKEAPNLRDADKIEALGGNSEAEGAIGKTDQDPAVSPSMIEPDPEPHMPSFSSPGALPASLAMSDEALYGRTFLRNADRRAWRRQMRSAHQ
jgi:hypothetical protein